MGQASSQHDRLTAALEAIVMGDRSLPDPRTVADLGWQGGLLQTATACAGGALLLPTRWRPHFQALTGPAAAINAFPYLWVMADAHGHHRAAVNRWVADLDLSAESSLACEQLFAALCQQLKMVPGLGTPALVVPSPWRDGPGSVGQALDLVIQSQGQFAVAQGAARQRGWGPAAIALVGLLTGLAAGRAGLGAALRQRWLLDYCPAQSDPWQGLEASALAALAESLHGRWAGVASQTASPAVPLGLRG
ncbi:hypothetical protein VB780_17635 [Leptolyngbya sp. CCNP1308]|uniref:hypothetical protein n=1 Tax=Leptolyngbya sp. CCNP1308 TaxID=3110255 RepID=UPI002B1FCAD3|nr:hypothetical protein [Leptolyngbya sp. CCNP1308]MEA5450407.1 hypothetical protein [Leptolyngbya sp. CCNP1308]